ncbi:hypothetical protein CDAR_592881, partial [Caerostris darwini]
MCQKCWMIRAIAEEDDVKASPGKLVAI